MIELFELLEERDLSEDGHGDAVLGEGEAHLLQGHDRPGRLVLGPVDGAVGACKIKGSEMLTWSVFTVCRVSINVFEAVESNKFDY